MQKEYLIIPSVPTPNGRLHLGHIGGPFLTADILAKSLQRQGHKANIYCGTDSYESFVLKKAPANVAATCNQYHAQIYADLQAMQISLALFVNPLADAWQALYKKWQYLILRELQKNKALVKVQEKMLWDEKKKHFAIGCYLEGQCPYCHANTDSYFCETCGAYFKPEDMLAPINDRSTIMVENIFMRTHKLMHKSHLHQLYNRIMAQQNNLMRISTNCCWGLPLPKDFALPKRSIFCYGLVFAYFLMLGDLYDTNNNPFLRHSQVITISCFGIDNTVPFLGSAESIAQHCQSFKAFDYYLANHFFYLEHEKFSKSKRHAIFVHDLIEKQKANSDIVRLFLASFAIHTHKIDFSKADFIRFYNATLNWLQAEIRPIFISATLATKLSHHELDVLMQKQNEMLAPGNYLPHKAIAPLYAWRALNDGSLFWLKGLALLMYPFMPKLSYSIWQRIGLAGLPNATCHANPIHCTDILFPKIEPLPEESLYATPL